MKRLYFRPLIFLINPSLARGGAVREGEYRYSEGDVRGVAMVVVVVVSSLVPFLAGRI